MVYLRLGVSYTGSLRLISWRIGKELESRDDKEASSIIKECNKCIKEYDKCIKKCDKCIKKK